MLEVDLGLWTVSRADHKKAFSWGPPTPVTSNVITTRDPDTRHRTYLHEVVALNVGCDHSGQCLRGGPPTTATRNPEEFTVIELGKVFLVD